MRDEAPSLAEYPGIRTIFTHEYIGEYCSSRRPIKDTFWAILCANDQHLVGYRAQIDSLISDALRRGLLDDDVRDRLRSTQFQTRSSALAELEAGYFLASRGISYTPRPSGRTARTGDFECVTNPPVFVEVKAIYDRSEERAGSRLSSSIWDITQECLESSPQSVLVSTRVKTQAAFSERHFRAWLRKTLDGIHPPAVVEYRSESGLSLEMRMEHSPLSTKAAAQMQGGFGGWSKDDFYIKASVTKAYEQLPDDGRPSLVIPRSFQYLPVTHDSFLDALFGHEVLSIPHDGRGTLYPDRARNTREPDGFFSPRNHKRCAAVGHLRANRGETAFEYALTLYHNPYARNPLDEDTFTLSDIRQLVPHGGQMRWLDDV